MWGRMISCGGLSIRRVFLGFSLVAAAAYAQDTRTVTEPVIPPSCFVLTAKLSAVDRKTLAATDEDKLDTTRIQKASTPAPKVSLSS